MVHLYRLVHVADAPRGPFGYLFADYTRAAGIAERRGQNWCVRAEAYDRQCPPQADDFYDAAELRAARKMSRGPTERTGAS